jgi:hypothetical protein
MAMRASLALAIAASLAIVSLAPQQARAAIDLSISVRIAPPPLPVYEQPMIPGSGYIWTPGYWAYDPGDGYFWVPGTWIRPPYHGALWTPGYWGWRENVYVFNRGYWGRRVGYYGGINYGHGYGGRGYEGGYWRGDRFYYNRAANNINVNVHITNVYNKTIIHNTTINRYSYNGPGGAMTRPTRMEITYEKQKHTPPVADQVRQRDAARNDKSLHVSENKGNPPIAATERPGVIARPQGGQGANAGNDDRNNKDRNASSDKADGGNAAASGMNDNKRDGQMHGNPASSSASDRTDRADKQKEKATAGAAGNASVTDNPNASMASDVGVAKKPKAVNHPKRARPVSNAQDNGNAMPANANGMGNDNAQSPVKQQRVKQQRVNPPHPTADSPQQVKTPARNPRARQGQGQPRANDRGQPRQGKAPSEDRKPRNKDKEQGQNSSR